MLQSLGLQRAGHDLETEKQQQIILLKIKRKIDWGMTPIPGAAERTAANILRLSIIHIFKTLNSSIWSLHLTHVLMACWSYLGTCSYLCSENHYQP